ncbi:hypothetical protein [Microvirga sp. P5_D2]
MNTTLGFACWADAAVPGTNKAAAQELNASATAIPLPEAGYQLKPWNQGRRVRARSLRKDLLGSSEEIANASGMSVVPFPSRHSVYFANVPTAAILDQPRLRHASHFAAVFTREKPKP